MTNNTFRFLRVEKVLGEWAIVAYLEGSCRASGDGSAWLRGFKTMGEAEIMASDLQRVMDYRNETKGGK